MPRCRHLRQEKVCHILYMSNLLPFPPTQFFLNAEWASTVGGGWEAQAALLQSLNWHECKFNLIRHSHCPCTLQLPRVLPPRGCDAVGLPSQPNSVIDCGLLTTFCYILHEAENVWLSSSYPLCCLDSRVGRLNTERKDTKKPCHDKRSDSQNIYHIHTQKTFASGFWVSSSRNSEQSNLKTSTNTNRIPRGDNISSSTAVRQPFKFLSPVLPDRQDLHSTIHQVPNPHTETKASQETTTQNKLKMGVI
jgi:hypothetical protein